MIDQHVAGGAGVTVAAIPVPRMDATEFGVIRAAKEGHRIEEFLEKPADPPGLPGSPDEAYASMGNYVFTTDVLVDALREDAANAASKHDMGGDIIPMMVADGRAQVYDFATNEVPGATERDRAYWRDVGTLDSYFDAHMDLCHVHPVFNLYNERWPILTHVPSQPPAKFVLRLGRPDRACAGQPGQQRGHRVRRDGARVGAFSRRAGEQLVHGGALGAPAQHGDRAARRGTGRDHRQERQGPRGSRVVGVDKEYDRERGFLVSAGGITVVGKGQEVRS